MQFPYIYKGDSQTSLGAGYIPRGAGTSPGENNKDRERISRSQQVYSYNSQLPTVRGNGITSLMLDTPVKYITQRSKPRPKPAWRADPYFRRSM